MALSPMPSMVRVLPIMLFIICMLVAAPVLVLATRAWIVTPLVLVISVLSLAAVYMQLVICRSAVEASADCSLGLVSAASPSTDLAMSLVNMSQALNEVASLTEGSLLLADLGVFALIGSDLVGPSIIKYAPTTPRQSTATAITPITTFLFIDSPSLRTIIYNFCHKRNDL